MTKLPHDSWDVKGVEGPKYRVGPGCSVPGCVKFADHAHHIWRRSFLAGDYRWVELWNGVTVQNLTGLCHVHHEQVTVNESQLTFDPDGLRLNKPDGIVLEKGLFTWTGIETFGPLSPQPKTLEALWAENNALMGAVQLDIDGNQIPHEHVVAQGAKPAKCPTCGKSTKKEADLEPGPKRGRATWSVSVPKDERENGAEILDELELACAEKLGRADHSSHKYFTLAEVMAYFLQT